MVMVAVKMKVEMRRKIKKRRWELEKWYDFIWKWGQWQTVEDKTTRRFDNENETGGEMIQGWRWKQMYRRVKDTSGGEIKSGWHHSRCTRLNSVKTSRLKQQQLLWLYGSSHSSSEPLDCCSLWVNLVCGHSKRRRVRVPKHTHTLHVSALCRPRVEYNWTEKILYWTQNVKTTLLQQ